MSRPLIAMAAGLVVGAVAGAGAMAFLGGGGKSLLAAQAKTQAADRDGESATPSTAPALALVDPSLAPERVERAAGATAIPGELSEGVGELMRRAPGKPVAAGDRALKGRVVDVRGNPLAGVVIRAVRHGDPVPLLPEVSAVGRGAPPPPSLEESVRTAIAAWYETGGEFREVMTGGDGRYELAELRDGQYTASAWKSGWVFDSEHGRGQVSVRPDAKLDWNGKAVRSQQVVVELPDGSGAPCANVEYRKQGHDDSAGTQGWLANQPTIVLEPGSWELRATLGHPQSGPAWPDYLVSPWVKVAESSGGESAAVTVRMVGKAGVRGRVTLSTGKSAPQALVKVKKLESGESADPESMRDRDDDGGTIQSDWIGNGEYTFVDLKPGRYLLTAQRHWNAPILIHAQVEVDDKMVQHDLVMPELDRATCLEVTVRAPDGTLVPEINFQWRFDGGDNNYNHGDCTSDRRDVGVWWLPLEAAKQGEFDPLGAWPSGSHLYLIADHADYGSTAAEVFAATRSLEVKFGPPATLRVTVLGMTGANFAGTINLGLNRVGNGIDSAGHGAGGQPNKEEGVARLGPVEAGRWKLTMWMSSNKSQRWNQFEAASAEVTLTPGENEATLSIPTLYSMVLRLPEGVEGQINLEQTAKTQNRRWLHGQIEKDGAQNKAVFEDIPAGEYRATLQNGPKPGVMTIHVPGNGGVVDWAPQPINAVLVTFNENSAAVAELGFADGDIITAIDGKEVASSVDLQVMWTLARAQREIELTIQRGGEAVTLKVDGKKLMAQGRSGAMYEPTTR
ncbi:MAG: PDZ domain-containing protein [Myxococcales bacterium]|nr:PDZ domain-containing protein [Myxococcales bacterium]